MNRTPYRLAQDSEVLQFETPEACVQLCLQLAAQAVRSLRLVSADLERSVYGREPFVEAVSRLARRSRYSEVQILIADAKALVGQHHALVALHERLPSKIALRVMNPDYPNTTNCFLLADSSGVMFRKEPSLYHGFACFNDPGRCRQLSETFEAMWQRATPSLELRRLSL